MEIDAEIAETVDELVVAQAKCDAAKAEMEAARGTPREAISKETWEVYLSEVQSLELYKANLVKLR
jgi:hypothetical protein